MNLSKESPLLNKYLVNEQWDKPAKVIGYCGSGMYLLELNGIRAVFDVKEMNRNPIYDKKEDAQKHIDKFRF